jgi:uncharacterized protein (DUF2336 family)
MVETATPPTTLQSPRFANLAWADEASRVRVAASPDAPEATLGMLAADPEVTVRAALVMNPGLPGPITSRLAQDRDDRIRILLARRLASLIPSVAPSHRDHLQDQATAALFALAADEVVRVRATIADVVKEMPEAPRELILKLIRDVSMAVAEPVIRLSPLLSAEDLLALLAAAPTSATATAVARRPNLSADVSDAIAHSTDTAAITALLTNPSAAIRENTLDALISRAADQVTWHEPLVRRPELSSRAARALSDIVATQLIAVLAERADLDPQMTRDLRQRLNTMLEPPPASRTRAPTMDEAVSVAHAMAAQGKLNESALLSAAQRGEARMCTALLAVAAEVPASVVDRACTLRTPKGLVSLIWKAGFSMRVAGPLQTLLAKLPPDASLYPTSNDGFPLAVEEMRWQIEFLTRSGR